ncbi:hypothetical protein ACFWY5_37765 [Nonomuraea sp. NPDC059007]|uniref:hypothetical protein n=1 Tax=Nonomuraea sp. NPDC059007 TaxID=3346692 RepID=UPI003690F39F
MGLRQLATALTILLVSGSSALPAVPSVAHRPPLSAKQLRESLMADCMKRHRFRYIQDLEAPAPMTEAERGLAEGDYTAMLADREKNGFRIFARFVFPADTGPGGVAAYRMHPNTEIIRALSRAQARAYFAAQTPCYVWAAETALGRKVTSYEDLDAKLKVAAEAAMQRALDSDPRLTAGARDYAACLKSKGRPVADPRPSQITSQVQESLMDQLWELGRRQWPRMRGNVMPDLSRFEAEPYFREEVRAALDDLECGKDFYPAYQPRANAVYARVNREWGQE